MANRKWILVLTIIFTLVSCQRFQPMENREGLDNDSHSYSYMGYSDGRIIRAARSVKGVEDASVNYNGRNLIVQVKVQANIDPNDYSSLKKSIQKKIASVTPINPFHITMKRAKP